MIIYDEANYIKKVDWEKLKIPKIWECSDNCNKEDIDDLKEAINKIEWECMELGW